MAPMNCRFCEKLAFDESRQLSRRHTGDAIGAYSMINMLEKSAQANIEAHEPGCRCIDEFILEAKARVAMAKVYCERLP